MPGFGVVAVDSFSVEGAAGALGSTTLWLWSPLVVGHCGEGTEDDEEMKKRRMMAWRCQLVLRWKTWRRLTTRAKTM